MKESYRKIAVLLGGVSGEREISLQTGIAVSGALENGGYEVTQLDPRDENFVRALMRLAPDAVFNCLHGAYGEDGTVQGLLESLHLPYTGSGVMASSLCFNKLASKGLARASGTLTADVLPLRRHDLPWLQDWVDHPWLQKNPLPYVVKPNSQGSSLGISIVSKASELAGAIKTAFATGDIVVLVEKFIRGREITVGVVDGEAFPAVEIQPHGPFYDFASKYQVGGSNYLVPAPLSQELAGRLRETSLGLNTILGCRGAVRLDYILSESEDIYFLEANTVPGMTETSLLPKGASAAGVSLTTLVDRMIKGARCCA